VSLKLFQKASIKREKERERELDRVGHSYILSLERLGQRIMSSSSAWATSRDTVSKKQTNKKMTLVTL
jgi:hypothetical protein